MEKKSGIPKSVVWIAAAVLLLVLLFLSNPSAAKHRQHIAAAFAEAHPVASVFGVGNLSAAAVGYHSAGLWSYTDFRGRKVSYGVLGMVFVP